MQPFPKTACLVPLRSKKAERFEKLLGFAWSHSIETRSSVSLSCAITPHPSSFSKSKRYDNLEFQSDNQ